ncbi:MAG: sulfotransferase [Planctomycetales bacterium]|nr:sulfotransferase [Planctomycetales bacterium]
MTQLTTAKPSAGVGVVPLPNFLIVGASRSGTTTLHGFLKQHPDVHFFAGRQELQFFHRESEYRQGLDAYRRLFCDWQGERAIGDVSPPYFFHGITQDAQGRHRWDPHDDAPARVAKHLPAAQILITLRNPVERAYSQYWKAVRNGKETARTFREAIELELAGKRNEQNSALCWIYKNRYSVHLSRWLALFPRERVEFFIFERWTKNPAELMQRICSRLGIDASFQPSYEPKNSGWTPRSRSVAWMTGGWMGRTSLGRRLRHANRRAGYPRITAADYRLVAEALSDDRQRLETLLDEKLDLWSTPL